MLTLHRAVVPTFLQLLPAASRMLDKAAAFAAARNMAEEALTTAAIAPDMWDFSAQIRALCVQSAGALDAVLTGEFRPNYPPAPRDFAGLKALVSEAIAAIKAIDPATLDARAGHDVVLRYGETRREFEATAFLTGFALPNFQFHAATAYALLRSAGVPLGKIDYLGRIPVKA